MATWVLLCDFIFYIFILPRESGNPTVITGPTSSVLYYELEKKLFYYFKFGMNNKLQQETARLFWKCLYEKSTCFIRTPEFQWNRPQGRPQTILHWWVSAIYWLIWVGVLSHGSVQLLIFDLYNRKLYPLIQSGTSLQPSAPAETPPHLWVRHMRGFGKCNVSLSASEI